MKVLHLISGGDTGGAKTHILSLFKGLNKLIDAKIICFIEDSFYHESIEAGIDIEVYEQKGRSDLSVVNRLAEEIKREDYDIIHCHGARANFIALFLRLKVKTPFITTVHSDYKLDFKDNMYKRIVFTNLNLFALKRFKSFIAVSDTFKEMLVSRGFKENNIYTVYNGIDLQQKVYYSTKEEFFEKYKIDGEGKIVVGIMARLDEVKDHETFLKAANKILEKREDIIFLIAGDGARREKLELMAKELEIHKNIYFLGYITDVYSFLNSIDINTLTSLSESFPYAILEGAFMKKPIVSTKVGGLVNLIEEGVNGHLVDIGDSDELAKKIYELSLDKEKIATMGENLYKKVKENYSSDRMAEDHVKIYEKIKDNSKKGE